MTESDKPFDMRRITPAIMIAFEKVEAELDIDIVPVLQNYTGSCPWDAPVGRLSELYHDHNVHGVIGPACSQGLESAGRLAQYLKMPMVSGLGDLLIREPFLGDMYTTLTLLSYNLRKLSCKYYMYRKTGKLNVFPSIKIYVVAPIRFLMTRGWKNFYDFLFAFK